MSFDLGVYLKQRVGAEPSGKTEWVISCIYDDCPDYKSNRKRLYMSSRKKVGWCHKCQRKVGLVTLIARLERLRGRAEVREWLLERGYDDIGLKLSEVYKLLAPKEREELEEAPEVELPAGFVQDLKRVPKFVAERVNGRQIKRWGIGWCRLGKHGGRVIVPIRQDGRVVSWLGRIMRKELRPGERKVINCLDTTTSHFLFGIDEARGFDHIVVVEGAWDVFALAERGDVGAVGLFGTYLSRRQKALIRSLNPKKITVLLDPDVYATAAQRVAQELRAVVPRVSVPYLSVDPDEAKKDELDEALGRDHSPRLCRVVEARLAKAQVLG